MVPKTNNMVIVDCLRFELWISCRYNKIGFIVCHKSLKCPNRLHYKTETYRTKHICVLCKSVAISLYDAFESLK